MRSDRSFTKAMEMRFGPKGRIPGKIIGMIPVLGSLGIAIGYSVVVGWFLKYLWGTISGELMQAEDMGAYFGELAVDFGSIGWHFLGLALTFAIMLMGVSKGIEKMNKVMMPIFFIFFILLLYLFVCICIEFVNCFFVRNFLDNFICKLRINSR